MARKDERRSGVSPRWERRAQEEREERAPFGAAESQEAGEELAPRDATRPGARNRLRPDQGRRGRSPKA